MSEAARTTGDRAPSAAKQRLLDVADRLFYTEGITTTGVDRIIAEAQVTKATFYKQFGSKDALILDYVAGRDRHVREALTAAAERAGDARAALQALIDDVVAGTARAGFRGDPFLNAAAEFSDPLHPVRLAVAEHRDWFTGFLEDRFRELGHPRPGGAADGFALLHDGVLSGAYAGDPIAATSAFTILASRLVDDAG